MLQFAYAILKEIIVIFMKDQLDYFCPAALIVHIGVYFKEHCQ